VTTCGKVAAAGSGDKTVDPGRDPVMISTLAFNGSIIRPSSGGKEFVAWILGFFISA